MLKFIPLLALAFALAHPAHADLNSYVLNAIATMPEGGGYAITDPAGEGLIRAISTAGGSLAVDARDAKPSFCTSATYLVLLKVFERLHKEGSLGSEDFDLLAPPASVSSLYKDDGVGIWGRWNANGPGTAKFFHDARLGRNFSRLSSARAGDFLKLWWTEEVGGKEQGHSVVYLSTRKGQDSSTELEYWSSNQGAGYTRKWIPLSKAKHMIFSRLESPQNLRGLSSLPRTDAYLKSCQSEDSSFAEARAKSGVTD